MLSLEQINKEKKEKQVITMNRSFSEDGLSRTHNFSIRMARLLLLLLLLLRGNILFLFSELENRLKY